MSSYRKRNSKIVKYKKTNFNIGSIGFVLFLIYIIVVSVNFLQKEPLSIYEVTEKHMSDNNIITGIALREETVYKAESSGSIAFYNGAARKVSKGSPLYSIDQTGAFSDYLANSSDNNTASKEEIASTRNIIHNYKSDYNNADYSIAEDFKYSIESSVLSLLAESDIENYINNLNLPANSYSISTASASGIVAYWTDGMENIKIEDINSSVFDDTNYEKNTIKTTDTVNVGADVCKVATSEKWNIVVRLNSEQYAKLEEKNSVRIRFCSDNLEVVANYELFVSGSDYYACIYMDEYLARYYDTRFINIELLLNSVEGLKIPKSAIFEKNCYKVPKDYITKGGQSTSDILLAEAYDKDGQKTYEEIESFCMQDDQWVYLDTDIIQPGTVFVNLNTNETYTAGEMQSLKGVYNVNKGYCQFKYVDILYENQEYCIIKDDTKYGLAVYDHIIINPELVSENDIIY